MAQPPKPKRRSPDEIAASVLGGQPSRPPRKDQLAEYAFQQTGVRRSPDEIAQSVLGRLPTPSLPARIGARVAGVLAAPGSVKRQTVANLMGIGKSEEEKRAIQAAADVFGAAELPKRKSLQPTFATARGVASVPLEIGKYAAVSAIPGAGLPLAMSLGAAEAAGGQAETSVPAMLSRGAGAVGMPRAERALGAVAESPVGRALFDVLAGEALAGGIKGAIGGVRTARQIGNLDKVRVDLGEAAVRGVPRQGPVAPPSLAFPDAFPRQAGQIRGLIPAQTGRPPRPAPDVGPSAVPVPQPESWRNQQLREAIQWAEQQRAQRRETQFAEEQAARATPQQGQVRGLLPSETGRQLRYGAMPEEAAGELPATPTRQSAPEPTRPQEPEAPTDEPRFYAQQVLRDMIDDAALSGNPSMEGVMADKLPYSFQQIVNRVQEELSALPFDEAMRRIGAIYKEINIVMRGEIDKAGGDFAKTGSAYDVAGLAEYPISTIEHNLKLAQKAQAATPTRKTRKRPGVQPEAGAEPPAPFPRELSATQMWNLVRSPRDLKGMSDEQLQQLAKAAPEALQIMSQRGTSEEWQRLSRMEDEVGKEIVARRMKRGEELAYAPPAPVVERPDVVVFGPQERVPVRYRVVDARSLVPSHSPSTFQSNPNYPKGVQGRNYDTDVAAQRNVESAAQNLDPDPLLDQTITPQSGAPVVTPSGVVVAGNQRSMIIARSIDTAPQRYAAYVQRLRQNAARYGLTADDFAGVERPVLVREMDEQAPEVMGALNRLSDVAPTKAKSQLDEAASRFQALRAAPRPLQTLVEKLGDDETLNAFLDRADGQRFVRELMEDGVIAPQEMGRYLSDVDRGVLNEEGKSLVQRMVAMAAVEDPVVVSRAPASALQKLEGAVPHIVRASGDQEWSITSVVRDALAVLTEARDKGLRVADLLSQVSAFDAPIPAAVQRMALFLNGARQTAVKQAFRRYGTAASEARARAVSGAADMFGDAVENSEQVQARLFGGAGTETRPGLASAVGLGAGQGLAGAAVGGATAEDEQDAIDRMVLFGMGAAGLGMAGYRGYQALRGSRPLPPPNPRIVTPAMQQVNDTIFRGGQRTGPTLLQQVKSWPPRAVKALKDFRTGWIDETRPLARAAREAGGEAGMRRVQGRIAEAHGALASARQVLEDRLGPVLKGMSDDELQATGVLLKARREGDLRAIYGPRKADVDDAAIQQAIVDAEAQPRVKAAADEVNKMFADLLEMRHQAGLLTDEAYFRIVNSETAYVAYIKEIAAAIATGGPMGKLAGSQGGAFARGTSGVQRMDRTVEDIARTLDPLEAVTMATVKTISDVRKQRVATTVLDLLESAGVPWLKTVQVNPNLPLKANQFKQIRGGVTRVYEVAPEYDDFVRAIDGQYQYSQVLLMRMMRGIKRMQTGGVVLEPTFQLYNVTRDTIMSALQRADFSRGLAEAALGAAGGAASGAAMGDEAQDIVTGAAIGGALGMYARPLANTLAAIKNIVRDEDVYKDFLRDGGSTEGFYVRNADDAHALIRRLTKGRGVPNILTLKGWGDVLSLIGSTGEQATRLAAYKEALGAGMSVPDAVMAAQDRTLNFAKRGATPLAKEVASVTPFWNAKMQGWDKLGRMLRNPKTYATGAAMITAPSVALWFENKDNPLYWQRPQWERNLFWLMPTPDGEDFVRIPKPFELGFMFGSSVERLLDYAAQRGVISSAAPVSAEPGTVLWRSLADIASTTGEGTLPVPPAIAIPAQLGSDRDWFRNRRIVTRPDLPAELQAQPETSAAARAAAERFGVSPEKVDFAVRNVTGTLGGEALRVTDMAARAVGLPSSEPSGGLPLLGRIEQRLITQNRGQTESEAAARNRLRNLERTDAGLKELMKAGDRARIAEYIRDNRDALLTIRRLRRPGEAGQKSLVRQLDDLQAMRRRAQQDVRFTPDERKQILARIRLKSAAISDRINAMTPQGALPSNR